MGSYKEKGTQRGVNRGGYLQRTTAGHKGVTYWSWHVQLQSELATRKVVRHKYKRAHCVVKWGSICREHKLRTGSSVGAHVTC